VYGKSYYACDMILDVKVVSPDHATGTQSHQAKSTIQDQKWQREASSKAVSLNNATGSRSVTIDSRSLQSDLDSFAALMSAYEPNLGQHKKKREPLHINL
jgi:hypothetical protein